MSGIIIVGKEQVDKYRLIALRSALSLECNGIKMRRGVSVYAIVKKEFNLTGNKQKVLEQFSKIVIERTGVGK